MNDHDNFRFFSARAPDSPTGKRNSEATGYSIWEWTKSGWAVKKDRSALGCVAQEPMMGGRFQGELRAVISMPEDVANG